MEFFETGQQFRHTFGVTPEVYNHFQRCSGDMNPLHVDKAFAQAKGFSDVVMYGNILNAFVSYFIGEVLPTKDVIIHAQDIKYKNPVFMNDRLDLQATVEGVYESVNVVIFKFKFINQSNQTVATGHVQIGVI